ncbi:MAG TPA: nucleoside triphosphate pyrophosphohydrolase [Candidatus Binatia bacterium]|nr:nucleoside triphosphate pyrophosphohydrolase [Candidatus Binatia bacterium]
MKNQRAGETFAELLDLMAQLRGDKGCPWDKEQSHRSLRTFLLEETHELLDALDQGDSSKIREELGDLLHQIIFHCQIGVEAGAFTAEDVVRDLKDKLIRRHPHVFLDPVLPDASTVLKQWAKIKAHEKDDASPKSALGNLPKSMPALARAQTITERASQVGFDWPDIVPVWRKVEEELAELKTACSSGDKQRAAEELGDLFFSLVNLSRFLRVQSEDVLAQATERFIKRFNYVEARLQNEGKSPAAASLEIMDRLWDEAKAREQSEKHQP